MSHLPFDDPPGAEPETSNRPSRVGPPPKPASAPAAAPAAGAPVARVAPVVPVAVAPRVAPISVSELSARLRGLLEESFAEVWVQGEISNGRMWNSGHYYFTLKDAGAQMKAVIFRSALRYLKFKPQDGLSVTVRGRISVYEPKGEYQLVCEYLEPQGLGALQLAFEQLKKKLAAEGLFDETRKRPLPALPRRIGIVTSIDGAALRDIVRVLRRRYPNAHLVVAPTRVQGEGAAAEIARALRLVARIDHVDVVIVGRGGGALEDLWAFNEEVVARAIAACPIPVISAVGHETDVTIADFAADLRAPTPSAAAEIVVRQKDEFVAYIRRLTQQLRGAVAGRRAAPGNTRARAPGAVGACRLSGAAGLARATPRGAGWRAPAHHSRRRGAPPPAPGRRRAGARAVRSPASAGPGEGGAPRPGRTTRRRGRQAAQPGPGPVPRRGRPARRIEPVGGAGSRLRRLLGRRAHADRARRRHARAGRRHPRHARAR